MKIGAAHTDVGASRVRLPSGQRRGGGARGGFTLVELLVVISIIAILLSILLSALGRVRNAGRQAKCLSNHHQCSIGWASYEFEHRKFPSEFTGHYAANGLRKHTEHRFDWGGVDFLPDDYEGNRGAVSAERPVNPYIGSDKHEKRRNEFFLCPSDDGMRLWNGNPEEAQYEMHRVHDASWNRLQSEDAGETIFAKYGNSYFANEWIWAKVGRRQGAWYPNLGWIDRQIWHGGNSLADVRTPSRTILTLDTCSYLVTRADEAQRTNVFGINYAWWHGRDRAQMSFMDGSARNVGVYPGQGASREWSFWLDESLHQGKSYVCAWAPNYTPRDKVP